MPDRRIFALYLLGCASGALHADHHEEGFVPIFDGKTLEGWSGIARFWSVEDGAITGQTTQQEPTRGNTFIIWRDGEVDDFELKVEYRIFGGNSGIQYRSVEVNNQSIAGYQADLEAGEKWTGMIYHEKGRDTLAMRGERATAVDKGIDRKGRRIKVSRPYDSLGDPAELQKKIRKNDWNEYHIIARGRRIQQKINGTLMADVIDQGITDYRDSGLLALQLHAGPPMKVQFRNIRLKRLKLQDRKKVVFVSGRDTYGSLTDEFLGGCNLLAEALPQQMRNFHTTVYKGFPKDPSAFDNADTIVLYSDGEDSHPFRGHLAEVERAMQRGVGLICLHSASEVEGALADRLEKWIGSCSEPDRSVTSHGLAHYESLPDHPITRGVPPFKIEDEWIYPTRSIDGFIPILTTRSLAGDQPIHTAWAFERADGGRGFGVTGGHEHANWSNDAFRTLVLNAIAWTAGAEVPDGGIPSIPVAMNDLRKRIGLPPQE